MSGRVLRTFACSPFHDIQSGVIYLAILATTADTDDRVVPAYSFKYVATLQASDLGVRTHLLRVESDAGHGSGKPTDKAIEEIADMWAFAVQWAGLGVGNYNVESVKAARHAPSHLLSDYGHESEPIPSRNVVGADTSARVLLSDYFCRRLTLSV